MGWFEKNEQHYETAYGDDNYQPHQAHLGHEVLAGGAAFAGFKAFEDHQRKEGKTVNHAFAKELLAGFAAAEIDKLVETKGEDWVDKEKAKRHAKQQAEQMYDEHYVDHHGAQEYNPNQYQQPQRVENREWYGN